jgi:hypothetical protein
MLAEHVQLMPLPDDLPHNIEGRHARRTGAGRGGPARDRRGRATITTIGRAEAMTKHTPGPWEATDGDPILIVGTHDEPGWLGALPIIATVANQGTETGSNARLLAQAPTLMEAGWDLATWAAAIHWSEHETNTADWLDGLRERIERFQEIAKAAGGPPCR